MVVIGGMVNEEVDDTTWQIWGALWNAKSAHVSFNLWDPHNAATLSQYNLTQ